MFEVLITGVLAFSIGVVISDLQKNTVDKAINIVKNAEAAAEATLAKITAHKAS
jgi:hypothetical protein